MNITIILEIVITGRFWLTIRPSWRPSWILKKPRGWPGGERPPGLNFKYTLRTIEKCKEMIVTRPSKLFQKCAVMPLG